MSAAIDTRIAGKTLAANGDIFSEWNDDDAGPFVRNEEFWCADLVDKWTCVAPSVSTNALFGLGVAITPRHILYHKHGGAITDGATLRFVAADDTIVLRTQDASTPLTVPDLRVGVLDSDLPATIVPCKTAPDDFASYASFFIPSRPAITFVDQEGKALVTDVSGISATLVYNRTPIDAQQLEFNEPTVANDSGKAWFAIINDELVLLGVTRDVTDAQGVVGWNSAINAAITALGPGGYAVSNPDLSGFPKI